MAPTESQEADGGAEGGMIRVRPSRSRRARRHLHGLAVATILTTACAWIGGLSLPPPTSTVPPPSATQTASPTPTETATPTPSPVPPTPTPDHPSAARILILSIDGLRPDAVSPESAPNIYSLAARGAVSWSAQTVLPSVTLPTHASMLSGYGVEAHGLTWNSYIPASGYARSMTVFTLAKAAGLRTVMIVSAAWLVHIAVPGTVDAFTYVPEGDRAVAVEASAEIRSGFGVLFVHLLGVDNAGHGDGWMSPGYLQAVSDVDRHVGTILDALAAEGLVDSTLVILTADHGGHDHGHGSSAPEDMTIPWVVAGPGVAAGRTLTSSVHIYDTAATALWVLGLPIPDGMAGQPVREAFTLTGN